MKRINESKLRVGELQLVQVIMNFVLSLTEMVLNFRTKSIQCSSS